MKFSTKRMTALVLIALCGVALFFQFRSKPDSFRRGEFELRRLDTAELASLAGKAKEGDCKSAYKVARHHLYYSLDHIKAREFFRIAATCPNPDALSHLADMLTDDPVADDEVDALLVSLEKLDPVTAQEASTHVAMRRAARKKINP